MSIRKIFLAVLFYAFMQGTAQAIVFDQWATNEGDSGNYILTVTDDGNNLNFNLTVDPWNAEALGLFIDFGDATIDASISDTAAIIVGQDGTGALSNVSPAGEVILYNTDTTSDSCGAGCNLNGLNPTLADPDDQWELVFRTGDQGFDNIQTFSWTIGDSGLNSTDIAMVGIRAQQLCAPGDTLPDGTTCDGSDKSYYNVPAPGPLVVMAIGLVGMLGFQRVKKFI